KEMHLKRDETLLNAGQKENYIYFVKKGALRVIYSENEREQNVRFGYEGSILTSLPAFFSSAPSLFTIRTIRKSVLDFCPKTIFLQEIEENETLKGSYLLILEELIAQLVERELDLLESSPKERYKRLQERSPTVFQEIPAKHIANYLRMTPEHFSRLQKS
ncbi:MAG TPA: Crp/Fnr family transcriptional regulator, partial [Cryomorphaceae bacterium]|nr:Crp/Fnr family transcriptional regulator [Cryomorphaceae bacterium]